MKTFKIISRLLIITTIFGLLTGCKMNGGLENGTIKGRLLVDDPKGGPIPPVKIYCYVKGSTAQTSWHKTIITKPNQGEYVIPDVPIGVYEVQYIIQGYETGWAWFVNVHNSPSEMDGDDTGDDTSRNTLRQNDDDNGSDSDLAATTQTAYVESGQTYVMPDIHLVKRESYGVGSVAGYVYHKFGRMIPVPDAKVIFTLSDSSSGNGNSNGGSNGGTARYKQLGKTTNLPQTFIVKTNEEGKYMISNLKAGKQYSVTVSAAGFKPPENDIKVRIAKNKTTRLDIYLEPESAVIRGKINISPSKFTPWAQNLANNLIAISISGIGGIFSNDNIQLDGSLFFEVEVPALLPNYTISTSAKNPVFDGTSKYVVPRLTPGQIYDIPEGSITVSLAHKQVIVRFYPKLDEENPSIQIKPPDGSIIEIEAKSTGPAGGGAGGSSGLIDTIHAYPAGDAYETTIDMPYGEATFTVTNVLFDPNKEDPGQSGEITAVISETSGDTVQGRLE